MRPELIDSCAPELRVRRRIAQIAGAVAASFSVVGMRQYGAIRHLPDPPIRGFCSDAVVTSRAAYPLGVPDSALAVVGCGALVVLATAGGTRRARWLDRALVAGIGAGALGTLFYLGQMVRLRRACAYCLANAAGMLALVPLAARYMRLIRT